MSTWVFLRGLTREARHWGDFPDKFRAEVAHSKVVTPDLPGNGSLNHAISPLSIREMVEHCREELTQLGNAPPYHLLGLSLGAMVTAEWATRYPQELEGCALINTSMRPFSTFYQRLRPNNYMKLLSLVLQSNDAEKAERAILMMTTASGDQDQDVVKTWAAYRHQRPITRMNALRQLIAAARYRAPLRKPDVPTLLLASDKDGLVNPQCSRAMANSWNAKLVLHPSAGHDLPFDDGVWVARQVHEWLLQRTAT